MYYSVLHYTCTTADHPPLRSTHAEGTTLGWAHSPLGGPPQSDSEGAGGGLPHPDPPIGLMVVVVEYAPLRSI